MNEPRHNTHLIVTVLSACVALMCGVPSAQAAQKHAGHAELAGRNVLYRSGEARPQLVLSDERETTSRAARLIRFSNFQRTQFLQLLDLAAVLPGLSLYRQPDTFATDLSPVGENTHSLALPINLSVVTRLPRAGLI